MSNVQYTFKHSNISDIFEDDNPTEYPCGKEVTTTLTFDEAAPWTAVVTEFVNFLSSVYGYPIDLSKHYGD